MKFRGEIAKSPEKSLREFLLSMKSEYSDEIPEEIIHSTTKDNKFKVRKGWFVGLKHALESAIDKGEIADTAVIAKVQGFIEYVSSMKFITPTTKVEIDTANQIIDLVVGVLPEE